MERERVVAPRLGHGLLCVCAGGVGRWGVCGGCLLQGGRCQRRLHGQMGRERGSGTGRADAFLPSVSALAVSGGELYAGGDFTTAGGVSANYMAKWDGSGWSALGSGMGRADAFLPSVSALAVSGGDLYAGGA